MNIHCRTKLTQLYLLLVLTANDFAIFVTVDSLGTISDTGNAEEDIVGGYVAEEQESTPQKKQDDDGSDKARTEKKSSFDSVEDDAIWDVRVDEMQI